MVIYQYKTTPKIILLFLVIAVIGAFFPIYGFSLGGFKLTLFRLGVFPLFLTQISTIFKYNKNLILLILLFLFLRCLTLLWTEDFQNGVSQVFWFFEGTCFLLSVNSLANKYYDFDSQFVKGIFIVGTISILFIFLQAILYFGFGYKLYVPFSQNIQEIAKNPYLWNYPLYGSGRIIGPFYEPNMAGSMCCYFFAMLIPFVNSKEVKFKNVLILGMVVVIIASIFTGSRQSLVSIVISILLCFTLFSNRKFNNILRVVFVIGILAFVVSANVSDNFVAFLEESDNVFSRIEESSDVSGGRIAYMQHIWRDYGMNNFFLGVGEGTTHGGGHNVFLAVFLENGIFAFVVFLLMLISFLRRSYRSFRHYSKTINLSAFLIVISWIFLMLVNWAQLNQSLSFIYIGVVFLSLSKFTRIIH